MHGVLRVRHHRGRVRHWRHCFAALGVRAAGSCGEADEGKKNVKIISFVGVLRNSRDCILTGLDRTSFVQFLSDLPATSASTLHTYFTTKTTSITHFFFYYRLVNGHQIIVVSKSECVFLVRWGAAKLRDTFLAHAPFFFLSGELNSPLWWTIAWSVMEPQQKIYTVQVSLYFSFLLSSMFDSCLTRET